MVRNFHLALLVFALGVVFLSIVVEKARPRLYFFMLFLAVVLTAVTFWDIRSHPVPEPHITWDPGGAVQ